VISFFVKLMSLARTLAHGLRNDLEFRAMGVLLVALLAAGTLFYRQVEGWSVVDSLYFSVMTLSTVGYGDLAPAKDLSKLFTIVFALTGIGLFASFVGKLVALRMQLHAKVKKRLHHAKEE